jgi:hypothetical protein
MLCLSFSSPFFLGEMARHLNGVMTCKPVELGDPGNGGDRDGAKSLEGKRMVEVGCDGHNDLHAGGGRCCI